MAFKLGRGKQNYMVNGEIRSKLSFNKEAGDPNASVPGTPVIRKDLEEGVMGEANMDGTIYINSNIPPGSDMERQVINHEMRHATDIRVGKLKYADDHIKYNGDTFERKTIEGKDMIKVEGEWKEAGHTGFPWEHDANNGIEKS